MMSGPPGDYGQALRLSRLLQKSCCPEVGKGVNMCLYTYNYKRICVNVDVKNHVCVFVNKSMNTYDTYICIYIYTCTHATLEPRPTGSGSSCMICKAACWGSRVLVSCLEVKGCALKRCSLRLHLAMVQQSHEPVKRRGLWQSTPSLLLHADIKIACSVEMPL